jgi:hypothetical protein
MRVYRRSTVGDRLSVSSEAQSGAISPLTAAGPVDSSFGLQPNRHRQLNFAAAGSFAVSEASVMRRASPSMKP